MWIGVGMNQGGKGLFLEGMVGEFGGWGKREMGSEGG